jgi:hypothetical protein
VIKNKSPKTSSFNILSAMAYIEDT